ncbi:hypothetical protein GIB67_023755 [Kingdonia uniflora]|uniref:Uncharacterized protein n=1 Tax=Kingdonia uniflora TaxID=39325 RepID=A0A7J7LG27_9MAGN|nr:hypothetical protein GIB67_023755 [Kingdonia uniflora]
MCLKLGTTTFSSAVRPQLKFMLLLIISNLGLSVGKLITSVVLKVAAALFRSDGENEITDVPSYMEILLSGLNSSSAGLAFFTATILAKEGLMIEARSQCEIELWASSNALGLTLGKDKKGHMMAMGIDITPSFVANTIHIVEENEDLKAINNELKTMLLNMQNYLDDHIKKTSGTPQIQSSSSYNVPSNSSQATQRKQSYLNRECKFNSCPDGIVAYGIVVDVSPDVYCHNT